MFLRLSCSIPASIALAVVIATSASAQTSPSNNKGMSQVEKTLRKLYERLLVASKEKDEKTLRQILTENYTQVVDDGRIRTRDVRIKETLSPDDVVEVLSLEKFELFPYQNSAVAVCHVRNKRNFAGQNYDLKIVSTATFVKESGVWRIAATHITVMNREK